MKNFYYNGKKLKAEISPKGGDVLDVTLSIPRQDFKIFVDKGDDVVEVFIEHANFLVRFSTMDFDLDEVADILHDPDTSIHAIGFDDVTIHESAKQLGLTRDEVSKTLKNSMEQFSLTCYVTAKEE